MSEIVHSYLHVKYVKEKKLTVSDYAASISPLLQFNTPFVFGGTTPAKLSPRFGGVEPVFDCRNKHVTQI